MINEKVKEKLKDIFENIIESDFEYSGDYNRINYYSLFCKSASSDKLYKIMGSDLCMFHYRYKEKDSILMIFFIAINQEEPGSKNVADRVIEIIEGLESTFITLDFIRSEEIKEDKFAYLTAIKILPQEE